MLDNKNLIEILNIEGNELAVSRQGINNCMVNLTQMSKPYGPNKAPDRWLRSTEAKEFLTALEEEISARQIWRTQNEPLIIKRIGNSSEFEQGTWCTDYHVAIKYAMWLNPHFGIAVIDGFVKFLTGRNVGTLVNTKRMLPRDRKDIDPSFWTELRKYVLPKDIRDVAARMNVTLRHAQKVLAGTVTSYPVMEQFVTVGASNRANGIMRPESGNYEQLAFQFVEPNAKED